MLLPSYLWIVSPFISFWYVYIAFHGVDAWQTETRFVNVVL